MSQAHRINSFVLVGSDKKQPLCSRTMTSHQGRKGFVLSETHLLASRLHQEVPGVHQGVPGYHRKFLVARTSKLCFRTGKVLVLKNRKIPVTRSLTGFSPARRPCKASLSVPQSLPVINNQSHHPSPITKFNWQCFYLLSSLAPFLRLLVKVSKLVVLF